MDRLDGSNIDVHRFGVKKSHNGSIVFWQSRTPQDQQDQSLLGAFLEEHYKMTIV